MVRSAVVSVLLLVGCAVLALGAERSSWHGPMTAAASRNPVDDSHVYVKRHGTGSLRVAGRRCVTPAQSTRVVTPRFERVPAGFRPEGVHVEGNDLWVIVTAREPSRAETAAEVAPLSLQLRDARTGRLRRAVRLPTDSSSGSGFSDVGRSTWLGTREGTFLLDPTSRRLIGRRVTDPGVFTGANGLAWSDQGVQLEVASGRPTGITADAMFAGLLAQAPGALWTIRHSCGDALCSTVPASLVLRDPMTGAAVAEDGQISIADSAPTGTATPQGLWLRDGIGTLFRWPTGGAVTRVGTGVDTEKLEYRDGRVWAPLRTAKGISLVAFDARTGRRRDSAIADPRAKASRDYPFGFAVSRRALWIVSQKEGALIRVPLPAP